MNESNRRNFLGLFGAGALIAPVIGGIPDENHQARLVVPAQFEPVQVALQPCTSVEMLSTGKCVRAVVYLTTVEGKQFKLYADNLAMHSFQTGPEGITGYFNGRLRVVPGMRIVRWHLDGECLEQDGKPLMTIEAYDK